MELNNYQKQVMRDLSAYLDCVNRGKIKVTDGRGGSIQLN